MDQHENCRPAPNSGQVCISISGIDGAGKTTAAQSLGGRMASAGCSCCVLYGRYQPFARSAGFQAIRFSIGPLRASSETPNLRNTMLGMPLFRGLYRAFVVLHYIAQMKQKLSKSQSQHPSLIVLDRYVEDTLIMDLGIDPGRDRQGFRTFQRLLYRFLPEPTFRILIDIPARTAFRRRSEEGTVGYFADLRRRYLEASVGEIFQTIDGERQPEKVIEDMLSCTGLLRQ